MFIHIGNTLHHISTSRLQCSIIYVIIAIIFFTGDRKPLNLKYWPKNEEVQMAFLYHDFLQLFLRLPLGRKVLEHFSFHNFTRTIHHYASL